MPKLTRPQLATLVLCLAVLTAVVGCYSKRTVTPPDTYLVVGKVVSSTGQIPAGYRIKFTSPDPERSANSPIEADGSFSLTTRYMSVACEGAAEGEYRVSLIPPLGLSNQGVPAVMLPKPFRVEARDNEFTIPFPAAK